jgi:apolipoprotein N-acyltransferase
VRTARQQLAWGAAAVLLSAAALWHGTGLEPAWALTWLAPLPVLAFALRASTGAAAGAAFAAWALGGLNLWHYYRAILGVPIPVVLVAIALPAVAFAAVVLSTRALARRGRHLLAAAALPSGWTAFEYAVSRSSPHGTFGSLAYTQLDCLPVVQVASLLGISGVTFLLMHVPGTVAVATLPLARRDRARVVGTTATAVALALAYGGWRLLREEPARTPVTVGLVAADRPEQPANLDTEEGERLLAGYAREAARLADRGAEVVVLPETVVRVGAEAVAQLRDRFAAITQGRVLVVGADRLAAGGEANVALALVAGRSQPAVYAKQHLLSPFESRFRPGHELTLLDTRWAPLGLAVCKDTDFPALGRRYAKSGASMLLVPAWDFTADGWLHSRMAMLRGVEGGFAVARAARGGRLTISDDRGRVVAEAASADAPVASVLAEVRLAPPGTPYTRLGDWFAWLAGAVFALALVTGVRARSAREVVKP